MGNREKKGERGEKRGKIRGKRRKEGESPGTGAQEKCGSSSLEHFDAHPGEALEFPPQLVALLGLD